MKDKFISQGHIYMCDFSGAKGSEQKGTRPALVVTSNVANQFSNVITVIPLTTKHKNSLPVHYILLYDKYKYLSEDSVLLCEQIRTVDKERIGKYIGKIDLEDLVEVIDTIGENLKIYTLGRTLYGRINGFKKEG